MWYIKYDQAYFYYLATVPVSRNFECEHKEAK